MKIIACIAALTLAGCSLAPGGSQAVALAKTGLEKAVADVKQFNDGAMQLGLDVICAPSVGAYFRLGNGNQKTAVRLACDPGAPIVVLPDTAPATVMVQPRVAP